VCSAHAQDPSPLPQIDRLTDSLQLAWIISFFASVFAQIQSKGDFPEYTWWAVVFYFFLVIGIFIVVASDTTQTYHVAVVGYLAVGLVLSTSSVNALVYSSVAAREAASAGFILLSMVTVCLAARPGPGSR
jgi:SHO1 osmosensor